MNITLTIPDAQVSRVINALCIKYGYQDMIIDPNSIDDLKYIPNPQTKAQFARQSIINFLRQVTVEVELEEAKKALAVSEPDVS